MNAKKVYTFFNVNTRERIASYWMESAEAAMTIFEIDFPYAPVGSVVVTEEEVKSI